uniref:Putative ribonuclease H-like domain-containing protein n=1 Tax=Tanacetum cinerariifolium TaxID=118510 RepID=A0A6L2LK27_TANCI|nr:putative ribonuclease H-like domain-containing protein [Tanacetum cinerariifolium]
MYGREHCDLTYRSLCWNVGRQQVQGGPYTPTVVVVPAVPATDDSLAVPKHTIVETPMNMYPENKAHYQSEKEAIHLILTGIGDEIYSTIDACKTAQEMWEAIERLQQGESLNIQDPEWSRFVMIVKQQHKLDEVSYHKLFDILKQYQKEVNELCAKRIAKNANRLALVATSQPNQDPYYQTPKPYKPHAPTSKASIPTRSHATTRNKGKEIAKPITTLSESDSKEDNDPEQGQRDKDMQKNLALIVKYFKKIYKSTNNNLITYSNSRNKNVDNTPRKPKRVKDSAYHKEKMLLCKQAEKEAHYSYMAKIQEVPIADSGIDSKPLEQNDQNDVECEDERVVLANLIANLKLDVDENKNIQKQLKEANTSLAHELEQCKSILVETSKTLEESNSVRDSCLVSLQTKQTEFEKYKACNDRTVDYDKLEHLDHFALRKYGAVFVGKWLCGLRCVYRRRPMVFKSLTKKPNVVPISTRKPKAHANKSVAIPPKKKVALKTTTQKPKSYYRMLYEKTSNLKLLCNFVEKYLDIVRFGNDQFAPILGYGDLVKGNITTNRVYYIEGLNHNLFSVGQFCDADLEVAFWKSTCFVRDLYENDLLTDRGTEFLNKILHAFFKEEGIEHQTSTPRTPEQNGVVERRNRTLVEAAQTMLSTLKLPLFFWAEAIATACYTEN